MRLIGLTGGIAAGKSTVAARLAEHGAIVIDADRVAREVVEPGAPALARIAERFGDDVLADGALDRAALGAIVFADADARRDLERITHPAIQALVAERIAVHADDPDAVVVYDVPLLVEARVPYDFDAIVVAHAPAEQRVARLVELRGVGREDAERRVRSQASDDERLAVATVVVDTSGTMEETIAQVDALWRAIEEGTAW
ncbi:dephospho-CoA kinase [Agrococcus sp. SGAir0287]|uniref:dephospho-CoA kinase n=1 Tax=Agrococcus sp. SGAir0287 TaxID=2070347 RepID=UPI0010CCE256|nr:dephospho-CoA kinase [Agrococcus sp. SGAir0287]QCR19282.1 dephospho-CoA kinase [Agrococcus sp. SGAir0287]